MIMSLLPIFTDGLLRDGSFIRTLPFCLKNCASPKCRQHYQAMQAQLTGCGGQGIGLHFAKSICALHQIGIDFSSSHGKKDHGVIYGPFCVGLHFDRNSAAG